MVSYIFHFDKHVKVRDDPLSVRIESGFSDWRLVAKFASRKKHFATNVGFQVSPLLGGGTRVLRKLGFK